MFLSIFLFVGLVVGGVASIAGAIPGAAFIVFIPNVADHISKSAPSAVYGVLLIALLYLMPTGVAGFIRTIQARLARKARVTTN